MAKISNSQQDELYALREQLDQTRTDVDFLVESFNAGTQHDEAVGMAKTMLEQVRRYLRHDPGDVWIWLADCPPYACEFLVGNADQTAVENVCFAVQQAQSAVEIDLGGDGCRIAVPIIAPQPAWLFLGVVSLSFDRSLGIDVRQTGTLNGIGLQIGIHLDRIRALRAARRESAHAAAAAQVELNLADGMAIEDALSVAVEGISASGAVVGVAGVVDPAGADCVCVSRAGDIGDDLIASTANLAILTADKNPDPATVVVPITVADQLVGALVVKDEAPLSRLSLDVFAGVGRAIEGSVNRHQAELELDEARRSRARMLVEVQERERTAIAADIHDGAIQQMSAAAMHLELAELQSHGSDPESLKTITNILGQEAQRLRETIRDLRELLINLRPKILDDQGLESALQELGQRLHGINVTLKYSLQDEPSDALQITIFRIVQEALSNVAKHASARMVTIMVARDVAGHVSVEVRDDGVGIGRGFTGPSEQGERLGLLGMRERAAMNRGTFSIQNLPGQGATVRVTLSEQ